MTTNDYDPNNDAVEDFYVMFNWDKWEAENQRERKKRRKERIRQQVHNINRRQRQASKSQQSTFDPAVFSIVALLLGIIIAVVFLTVITLKGNIMLLLWVIGLVWLAFATYQLR